MNQSFHKYFNERSEHAGYCVYAPTIEAHFIEHNMLPQGNLSPLAETFDFSRLPYSGYIVFDGIAPEFLPIAEFNQQYVSVDEWLQKTDRMPLGDKIFAQPINKGTPITVHAMERSQQKTNTIAPNDGWIVNDLEQKRVSFLDDLTFRSLYQTTSAPMTDTAKLFRHRNNDAENLKIPFIKMDSDLLVRSEQGVPHNFLKGSFMIQIPKSLPREYTVLNASDFFQNFALTAPLSQLDNKQETVINVDFRKKRVLKP